MYCFIFLCKVISIIKLADGYYLNRRKNFQFFFFLKRNRMFEEIDESFKKNNTRLDRRSVDINTLLNPEARTVVEGQTRAAVLKFIFSAQIQL